MQRSIVMKFGGTSMGDAAAIRQAAVIVWEALDEWQSISIVVSAMSGVTDMLLEGANTATTGQADRYCELTEQIRQQHITTATELLKTAKERGHVRAHIEERINEFLSLCHAIHVLKELTPRTLDAVLSLGEAMSVSLLAAHLQEIGCPAEGVHSGELIRTDSVFQSAYPDFETTRKLCQLRLGTLLQAGVVPVITGFIGATQDGTTTTLGRGGSDFSAAIIGAALEADEVWIWTDVDGVMSTDPRVVPTARTLETVSYREISELAYFGAKVLHPKTIRPVIERDITLWIRNTFNPQGPATQVVANNDQTTHSNGNIRAVTVIKNQCLITIEGRGMIGVQGIAGRAFNAVARTGTSVSLISQASSEQSICFTLPVSAVDDVINSAKNEFRVELERRDVDRIWALDNVVIVTAVGVGMRHTPGIAGRIFSALGESGINVIAIAQGSSEVSVSMVVGAADADESVRAIHRLIEKHP